MNIPNLSPFLIDELELYIDGYEDQFKESFNSLVPSNSDLFAVCNNLEHYLTTKKGENFTKIDELLLLTSSIIFFWLGDYETIVFYHNSFSALCDFTNISLWYCFLLAHRELNLKDKFEQLIKDVRQRLIGLFEEERENFLMLALNEFTAFTDNRPEQKYKALNNLIRALEEDKTVPQSFPFIFDVLLKDLIEEFSLIPNKEQKEKLIHDAIKRAKNNENKGLLCSLYTVQVEKLILENSINEAEKLIRKGIKIAEELRSPRLSANFKLKEAKLLRVKGEISASKNIYLSLLNEYDLLDSHKIFINGELGYIELNNDNLTSAYDSYKQAHALNEKYGFPFPLIEIIFGYIRLIMRKDEGESIQFGKELAEHNFNFHALSYYYYYQGLYCQKLVNLTQAEQQFHKALDLFESQMIFEGIVYTQAALADNYLKKYKLTTANTDLKYFFYYIDNLLRITEELEHPLYIDATIAKASMHQHNNMLKQSKDLLKQGLTFAKKLGLSDKIEELNLLIEELAPAASLNSAERFFKKIRLFAFGKYKKIPTEIDLILLINEGGTPLFSYSFDTKDSSFNDDMLISGLISAIVSFSKEVLGREGAECLRSIKHEGKNVLIEEGDDIMAILVVRHETFETRLILRKFLKNVSSLMENKRRDKLLEMKDIMPLIEKCFEDFDLDIEKS